MPFKSFPERDRTLFLNDLATLRRIVPLVHCNTQSVAAGFMANVLLAIGASPMMVASREEVVEIAAIANAVLISVASITEEKAENLLRSASAACAAGTPWVLDPVAVGALRFRTRIVNELLTYRPTVIKGNASEIRTLVGRDGRSRGADSTLASSEAIQAAKELALRLGGVVVVTGATDFVTDGARVEPIAGGHPLMSKVTGTGCALGGVIGAFLPVFRDPLEAAAKACFAFALAGEFAGHRAVGPGDFAVHFLNGLWQLDKDIHRI